MLVAQEHLTKTFSKVSPEWTRQPAQPKVGLHHIVLQSSHTYRSYSKAIQGFFFFSTSAVNVASAQLSVTC